MKKNIVFACIIVLGLLSSCGVYSLYPIYTKDTLVKKDEVIGKWTSVNSDKDYIEFSSVRYKIGKTSDNKISIQNGADTDLEISFSSEDGDVIDTGDYVIENGDTTIWKDTVLTQLKELLTQKMEKVNKRMNSINDKVNDNSNKAENFKLGTPLEDDLYIMKWYENDEMVSSFKAHFVEIGDDLFIDLYPQGGLDDDNAASDNYFPVHTFLKVSLTDDRMELNIFDQKKLKNLFESNLIRIRHEIVNDKVLITAQPKEIQKFLDKYADDESVLEESAVYSKATP